jgi:probable O-glycosylation ligase (exosortase A-associated)
VGIGGHHGGSRLSREAIRGFAMGCDMKQMAFMLITLLLGTAGSFALSPVYGIAVYYLYAVLRPQFIWEFQEFAGIKLSDPQWSLYVALATLAATFLWRTGLFTPAKVAAPPWYGNPPLTRSHYLFLAFTAWISLTYFTAVSTERAWPFFMEYLKIFVMFICATFVLRTVSDLWLIYFVVLGAAIYVAYEINTYYLNGGWMLLASRGYGGLDNNGAALIVAMAIPMCFFAWEATQSWWRWGFLLVIPALLHAVLLSYSRGAMLSLCVAVPFILARTRYKWMVGIVYLGIAISIPVMAGKEIQERFFSIGKADVDESAQSRWTTWNIAIRMANESPFVGLGIRNSNLFTYDYGADMPGRSIHSQYLQTAADSGWIALGLYLLFLVSLFLGLRSSRRVLRNYHDRESLKVKSIASGVECAIVLFCFGAIFLSLEHFEMPYIMMLLAVQLHAITRTVGQRLGVATPVQPTVAAVHPPANRPVVAVS